MLMQQPADQDRNRVIGRNLSEALRNVRRIHGDEARIVDSRHVYRRDETGLGRTRYVEVRVVSEDDVFLDGSGPAPRPKDEAGRLAAALTGEVARIEEMIREISGNQAEAKGEGDTRTADYPLGSALRVTGVSDETIARLAGLFAAEKGSAAAGSAAPGHLATHLQGCPGGWDDISGCHLFLGAPGVGKTDLLLAAAAELHEKERKVLVLSLAPRHDGEVRRLQREASAHGYDAAIMKEACQLERSLEYFDRYDAVLIDTPPLGSGAMADPELRLFVSGQELIHRHLVLPLDGDLQDMADSLAAAKDWNCDWTAVTRLDRSRHPGKLADLAFSLTTPFSLLSAGSWPGNPPRIASSDELVKLVLGVGRSAVDGAVDVARAS